MNTHYTYLLLDIGSIFFPFLLSFDRKVHFYTHWLRLFPALLINAIIFIVWDEIFTREGIWSFNSTYLLGYNIGSLPVEEWLFFLAIPYACIFIYQCLKEYFKDYLQPLSKVITVFLLILSLILIVIFNDRLYTLVTFTLLMIILLFHWWKFGTKHLGYFYFMWIIHLIPFGIINGFLTSLPVVQYNDMENMSIRIGTIPFEDAFYSMVKLLLIVTIFEWQRKDKRKTI